jgi:hypothetical protein
LAETPFPEKRRSRKVFFPEKSPAATGKEIAGGAIFETKWA